MTTAMPPLESPAAEPTTFTNRAWQFFFRPAMPNDLGICRFLFYGCLFIQYLGTDFAGYGDLPTSFYNTLPLFRLLHIPILSVKYLAMLEAAFKLGLLGACVGRFTKLSSFVAAIAGSYRASGARGWRHHHPTVGAGVFVLRACVEFGSLVWQIARFFRGERRIYLADPCGLGADVAGLFRGWGRQVAR
jgi:hypothetical protein